VNVLREPHFCGTHRTLGLLIPSEPIDQLRGIHLKTLRESQEALQTQVSLTPLYRRNEGEVQPDPLCECHLAQAQFGASRAGTFAYGCLCRMALS